MSTPGEWGAQVGQSFQADVPSARRERLTYRRNVRLESLTFRKSVRLESLTYSWARVS
jgi:hypothetical protein